MLLKFRVFLFFLNIEIKLYRHPDGLPVKFRDWEANERVINPRELKKSVFAHGFEAKTSSPEDFIGSVNQPDGNKFTRPECSRVTNENLARFRDEIILDLASSERPGLVTFQGKMPYYQSQQAQGYLDITTGNCVYFHTTGKSAGKFWSFKKYKPNQVLNLIGDPAIGPTIVWQTKNSNPGSEL